MQAFKKPLLPDQEEYYLKLCRAGDADARRILIESNMRLVAHIANTLEPPTMMICSLSEPSVLSRRSIPTTMPKATVWSHTLPGVSTTSCS